MPKPLYQKLIRMPRRSKQLLLGAADALLLAAAAWAAYALRLGEFFIPTAEQALLIAAAPITAAPIFIRFGLYRSIIRYVGERALWAVVQAMSLAALFWTFVAFMTEMTGLEGAPRSIPVLYWLLGLVAVAGLRFGARWLLRLPIRDRFEKQPVLIWGVGEAGRQLAASLGASESQTPVGFLEDDAKLQGGEFAGLRVYAPDDAPWLIDHFGVRDVIISMSDSSADRRAEIVDFLERHAMRARVLPPLADIASGRYLVNMVREVEVGDLVGRPPVAPDPALLASCVAGKRVLVTGAGGSIGAELCAQIARLGPERLTLVEASEHALYQVDRRVAALSDVALTPVLGSAGDERLIARVLESGVDTVYHAAAHKHVPMVEANVVEGARNNVHVTRRLADAALEAGVETFVLISTDKAVRPTNVMGATKRWAELAVLDTARRAALAGRGQRFCAVRFGNVFGSSGSVIPLFREQIAKGGPITVTHREVTRYFMSLHEASELVIQAGALSSGGEIFLLHMGEPVKIYDIAVKMAQLAGLRVRQSVPGELGGSGEGDIDILVTGLRPGEKLYEELLIDEANSGSTRHPKIMVGREPRLEPAALAAVFAALDARLEAEDIEGARKLLIDVALDRAWDAAPV